jgi:hypothetical protein
MAEGGGARVEGGGSGVEVGGSRGDGRGLRGEGRGSRVEGNGGTCMFSAQDISMLVSCCTLLSTVLMMESSLQTKERHHKVVDRKKSFSCSVQT